MTQSGGQAAGIQLQVGLDLAYFRAQMQKVSNIASSEFTSRLDVRFNKRTLDAELNNLQRAIKRRVYRVEIGGNLSTLPAQIENLRKQLASLEDTKIDVGVGVVKSLSKKDAQRIKTDLRQSILGEDKKIFIPVSIKPSIAKKDVLDFKNAVQSKLSGITVKVKADLESASISGGAKSRSDIDADVRRGLEMISEIGAQRMAQGTGGVTEAARREQLRQSLTSGGFDIGGLKDIGRQLGITGTGRFKNANNLIEKIVTDASIEMVKKYLDPQAVMRNPDRSGLGKVLDTFARGVFNMLGMDSAAMLQQARQGRLPASINWQATAPRQPASIGPSSTGRVLPPGAERIGLPGTSFATQKLLSGDLLTPSMKAAIRDAANDLIDGIRDRINAAIRQVNVEDLGRVSQRMLTGSPVAGYLPPVARFGEGRTPSPYSTGRLGRDGETQSELFARREREARMRSAQREMEVLGGGAGRPASPYSYVNRAARPTSAMIPYAAGGALVPMGGGGGGGIPPRPPSGGSGRGGMANFGRALGSVNLPGAGVMREIGEEFAMAAKQVLLFGTAYKALAFLTSFPAQVGAAVGALQNFNNTLKAISPSAQEASASNQFILDIVDRYNVPLQSARDGFTKLYASMAPAGFKGDEIRALFTGVSQAAATFGMSADKVDRVNYAFAQMASKGQVMSEELKGQLGDVLPGAMGIFAEAAGFKGPQAIEKFSKALEDGAYKGDAMRGLLRNVTTVLTKEFGPGAEGAARTFQGVINRMQNSTKLLYEAFEPVAVGFLNSVVVPLTSGIKTVADGFTAFFTGVNAKTSGGFAIAQELEKLKPTFEGIRANVTALLPTLQSFASTLLGLGKVFLQIAGNPFVGYLTRVYLSVLPLTIAIRALNLQALIPLIASFLRAIPAFIAFTAATVQGATANKALQLSMQLTGQTAGVTAAQIRTVSVALKAAFASTVVLAIVAGIGMIIEKMISLGARMDEVRKKAMGTAESIRSMSQAEARQAGNQAASDVRLIQGISQRQQLAGRPGRIAVTAQEQAALERAGVTTQSTATRGRGAAGFTQSVELTQLRGAIDKRQGDFREAEYRQRVEKFNAQQQTLPTNLPPIEGVGVATGKPGGDGAAEKRVPLEQLLDMESQRTLRLNLSKAELRLTQLITAARLQGNNAEAESLEGLSNSLLLRIKLTAAQGFVNTLLDKESEIVGKSLTKEQFYNKLQEANVEVQLLSNDLKASYLEMQVKENEAEKTAQNALSERIRQQLSLNRLLEDAAISAGVVSPQNAAISGQRREFQDQLLQAKELGATPEQIASLEAFQAATPQAGSLQETLRGIQNEFNKLISIQETIKTSASAVGDAFGNAFKGVITGSMSAREALAGFFQSVADSFADMVAKMIAEYLKMALIKGIMSLIPGLGAVAGGLSSAFGASGPSFNAGAFSGPALSPGAAFGGGGSANFSGAFGGGAAAFSPSAFSVPAFANGGIVTGPTLGLVGEGRYNEAVIPLPDGKSVPVDLGGAMGNQITSNIVVNVSSDGKTSSSGAGSDSAGLGRKIEGAVKQVIVGELRPGGLLAGMR